MDFGKIFIDIFQRFGAAFVGIAMVAIICWAAWFFIKVLKAAKANGHRLVKIEDGAISPASITAYVALVTASVGGLWLAFSVGVSGSLDLQQLSLELAKTKNIPNMDIELDVTQLSQSAINSATEKAIRFSVVVKNKGSKHVSIKLQRIPLLTLSKLNASGTTKIERLPYRKIECLELQPSPCVEKTWRNAELEPEGTAYYTFLHPGLEPGIYFAQFVLPIESSFVTSTDFDKDKPVLWSRSTYFEVKKE